MNKLILIFDYFKEAFHINKQNKALYKPQIVLIAINVLLFLFVGIGIYTWVGVENIHALTEMQPWDILAFGLNQGIKLIVIGLFYALFSVLIEAGLLNMYKKAVTQGYTETGDFREGVSKYFLKLLLGKLLIFLCFIPALPVYLILGIVTLTVGLAVIPIVASVFLTMWKISLVMNDYGIIEALKDSFRFAKRNFIPLTVLQIIHLAFVQGASGSGGSANFNIPDTSNFGEGFGQGFGNEFPDLPGIEEGIDAFVNALKIIIAVLIPIIALATISLSIIAMIFEVFFSLALFVAYKNDFKVEVIQLPLIDESLEAKVITSEEAPLDEEENIIIDNEEANNGEVEQ
jgi:hypothetical protein